MDRTSKHSPATVARVREVLRELLREQVIMRGLALSEEQFDEFIGVGNALMKGSKGRVGHMAVLKVMELEGTRSAKEAVDIAIQKGGE